MLSWVWLLAAMSSGIAKLTSSVTGFLVNVSVVEMGGLRDVKKVINFVGSSWLSPALSMNGSRRLVWMELLASAHSARN
jgi:hypothetical protein